MVPEFSIVIRGYDREQVDQLIEAIEIAKSAGTLDVPAMQARAGRLPVVLRGYDRVQVIDTVARLLQ